MKKTIILMFILLLPLAHALYGGDTWSYHFDKCDSLEVTITGTDKIEEGEYTVLDNCTMNQPNNYFCVCEDNYDFNITFKPNAVNNYTLVFNYEHSEGTANNGHSLGGKKSSGTTSLNIKTLFFVSEGQTLYPIDGLKFPLKITNITNTTLTVTTRNEEYQVQLNETKEIEPISLSLNYHQYSNGRGRIKFIEMITEQIVVNVEDTNFIETNTTSISEPINNTVNDTAENVTGEVTIEWDDDDGLVRILIVLGIALGIVIIGLIIYFVYFMIVNKNEGKE